MVPFLLDTAAVARLLRADDSVFIALVEAYAEAVQTLRRIVLNDDGTANRESLVHATVRIRLVAERFGAQQVVDLSRHLEHEAHGCSDAEVLTAVSTLLSALVLATTELTRLASARAMSGCLPPAERE
jgi:hypothetical protein